MVNLVRKRDVIRNKADFDEHFICTKRRAPYGIWLNVLKLKNMPIEDRLQLIIEVFQDLELNG